MRRGSFISRVYGNPLSGFISGYFSKRDRILIRCLSVGMAIVCATILVGLIKRQGSASAHSAESAIVTPAIGLEFTVNSTADTPDAVVGNGICANSSGKCTLRA